MSADLQDDWRKLYRAALLELDPAQLHSRIEQASGAIKARMAVPAHLSSAQRQQLEDALANLRVLRREVPSGPLDRLFTEAPADPA